MNCVLLVLYVHLHSGFVFAVVQMRGSQQRYRRSSTTRQRWRTIPPPPYPGILLHFPSVTFLTALSMIAHKKTLHICTSVSFFFRRKLYWHSWNFTIIDAFAVDSRLMTVSSFHCWTGITLFVPSDVMSLASVKSRLVLPFWYWLTQVVLDKGPLNGCVCVCVLTFYCQ